jgi:hypothetical protein
VSVTERLVTLEYIQCENVFSVLIHSFYSHSLLQREELGTSELLLSDILFVHRINYGSWYGLRLMYGLVVSN